MLEKINQDRRLFGIAAAALAAGAENVRLQFLSLRTPLRQIALQRALRSDARTLHQRHLVVSRDDVWLT